MSEEKPLRLELKELLKRATHIQATVQEKLANHPGMQKVSAEVTSAINTAESVSQDLKRPFSLHRLPAFFLAAALFCLLLWGYWEFFHVSTLRIALPARDAEQLKEKVHEDVRVALRPLVVEGSRETVDALKEGRADLAFVQGGVEIPRGLPILETPNPEIILWLVRRDAPVSSIDTILTSVANEGSHTVAKIFCPALGVPEKVTFLHDWSALTKNKDYQIPPEVDAVFVVKDPSSEETLHAIARLYREGFTLRSSDIGARSLHLDFLRETELSAGYLQKEPPIPEDATRTYFVKTFLVARSGLTPKLLAAAAHLLEDKPDTITQESYELTASEAGEIFQGVDAFFGMLINIGLAFLALLGIEMATYRKRFHELNSLISLISMLQSNKDVLGVTDQELKAEHLLYLRLCSDLLGVISATAGYYTQENSSLLFSNLSEIIHQRCDNLKINIQLKISHASIEVPRHG